MYPSKVLIAGEYTVLLSQEALAVPFDYYSGAWRAGVRSPYVFDFEEWISHLEDLEHDTIAVNVDRIKYDYEQQIRYVSNIPQGYGLGSSGAIVAAFFDRYIHPRPEIMDDREALRSILAAMEAFFHGVSSGVDPLISYYNMAYWSLKGQVFMQERDIPDSLQLHIIVTEAARQSQPMIKAFQKRLKEEKGYRHALEQRMLPLVHEVIMGWSRGEISSVELAMNEISILQWELFKPMISSEIRSLWKASLEDDSFAIKLCGAGGGGAYLGIGTLPEDIKHKVIKLQ